MEPELSAFIESQQKVNEQTEKILTMLTGNLATLNDRIELCHKRIDLQGKMIDTLSGMLSQIRKDNLTKYAKRYCFWVDKLVYGYPLDSSNIKGTWDIFDQYEIVDEQKNIVIESFTIFLEKDVEIKNINGIKKAFIKNLK